MAKTLGHVVVRFIGDANNAEPNLASFIYQVLDNGDKMHRGKYVVTTPDFTKTIQTFIADEIATIKSNEGIT